MSRAIVRALASAALLILARPTVSHAEAAKTPVVGYLSSTTEAGDQVVVAATRAGLAQGGFVDGKNLKMLFRYSGGEYERLHGLAADLVSRNIDVMITSGLPATLEAKSATTAIPIVFRLAIDPVAFKLVQSYGRPGGNLTGVTTLFDPLTPKKLQLLHELVPGAGTIGFLINPKNANAQSHREQAEAAASGLGLHLMLFTADKSAELEAAFAAARQQAIGAMLLGDDPFFATKRAELADAANRHGIPTMYYVRDFVDRGGLISYGPNFHEVSRQSGVYAARILNGAKPAELPVSQPTKFELVINAKTAKQLGLAIPAPLLAQADEVIE